MSSVADRWWQNILHVISFEYGYPTSMRHPLGMSPTRSMKLAWEAMFTFSYDGFNSRDLAEYVFESTGESIKPRQIAIGLSTIAKLGYLDKDHQANYSLNYYSFTKEFVAVKNQRRERNES